MDPQPQLTHPSRRFVVGAAEGMDLLHHSAGSPSEWGVASEAPPIRQQQILETRSRCLRRGEGTCITLLNPV